MTIPVIPLELDDELELLDEELDELLDDDELLDEDELLLDDELELLLELLDEELDELDELLLDDEPPVSSDVVCPPPQAANANESKAIAAIRNVGRILDADFGFMVVP